MLASVLDANEAEIVLTVGADIIDLKDATRGPLAAVAVETAREAVRLVAARTETSATLGDPPYEEAALTRRARARRRRRRHAEARCRCENLATAGPGVARCGGRHSPGRHAVRRSSARLQNRSRTCRDGLQGRHARHLGQEPRASACASRCLAS